MSTVDTKPCTRCGEALPRNLDSFPPHKWASDGLSSWCRECKRKADRDRQAKNASRAEVKLPAHKTCYVCGETRPQADFPRNRTTSDGLNASCKPCAAATQAAYRSTRRATERGLPTMPYSREDIYVRDSGICAHCACFVAPEDATLDHLIPFSADIPAELHPGDAAYNVAVSCPSCNSRKGNRWLAMGTYVRLARVYAQAYSDPHILATAYDLALYLEAPALRVTGAYS